MTLQKNWIRPSIEVTAIKLAQNASKSGPADGTLAHNKS